jgi:hypothetical protein
MRASPVLYDVRNTSSSLELSVACPTGGVAVGMRCVPVRLWQRVALSSLQYPPDGDSLDRPLTTA